MSGPPGVARTSDHRRNQERRDQRVRTETLIRYANTLLDAAGLDRSASWVSRAVRDYARHGVGRVLFGLWFTDRLGLTDVQRDNAELAFVLAYADPTGEAAVRNVMRRTRRRDGGAVVPRTG